MSRLQETIKELMSLYGAEVSMVDTEFARIHIVIYRIEEEPWVTILSVSHTEGDKRNPKFDQVTLEGQSGKRLARSLYDIGFSPFEPLYKKQGGGTDGTN